MTTTRQFYDSRVFEVAEEFFNEPTHETPEHRSTDRITRVPARLMQSAVAVAAFSGLLTLEAPIVSASVPRLQAPVVSHAGAAVEIPCLSAEQVRGARLVQAAFEAVPAGEDADGEDPDYGF